MIGQWEIVIILVVVFLIFGGKRIPEIARGIGKGIREFKRALEGKEDQELKSEPGADDVKHDVRN